MEDYRDTMLQDHETRIRRLEESDIQQRLQLTNIEKTQSEIKLMINEGNNKLLDTLIKANTTNCDIRLIDRKEIWGVIALIVGGILAYLGIK